MAAQERVVAWLGSPVRSELVRGGLWRTWSWRQVVAGQEMAGRVVVDQSGEG